MHFKYLNWDERLNAGNQDPFETLWDLFQELLTISGGEVSQALRWLTELDKQYDITNQFDDPYSIGNFIDELQERGLIRYDDDKNLMVPTAKTEKSLRKRSLEEIFRQLNKGGSGQHKTSHTGSGKEIQPESQPWIPGNDKSNIDLTETMLNMLRHSSLDQLDLQEEDLRVHETDHLSSVATVLLIDVSHSMILYGEDRITPAKKVAMALSELILTNYSKDSLDIIAFGNEAWQISIRDLPYLKVGPYHTNTLEAIQMARHLLQRKKFSNKQIFMITDGKPSCMVEGGKFYKNSFGLDRKIVNKVLDEAVKCKKDKITITTFMIASDPYLQNFVRELTEVNRGRAYYSSLDNLGEFIFEDYIRNRKKKVK